MAEGRHERYLAECRRLAEGLPVHFHVDASPSELQGLYESATVYWHATGFGESETRNPIKCEHFGISVVEAMAGGCVPVVIGKGASWRSWSTAPRASTGKRAPTGNAIPWPWPATRPWPPACVRGRHRPQRPLRRGGVPRPVTADRGASSRASAPPARRLTAERPAWPGPRKQGGPGAIWPGRRNRGGAPGARHARPDRPRAAAGLAWLAGAVVTGQRYPGASFAWACRQRSPCCWPCWPGGLAGRRVGRGRRAHGRWPKAPPGLSGCPGAPCSSCSCGTGRTTTSPTGRVCAWPSWGPLWSRPSGIVGLDPACVSWRPGMGC